MNIKKKEEIEKRRNGSTKVQKWERSHYMSETRAVSKMAGHISTGEEKPTKSEMMNRECMRRV